MDRARSIDAGQELSFVSNFPVGHPSADPEVGEEFRPVTEKEVQRLLVATLASGVKGLNFNMFVGRDRWYGAALSAEGTIGPSYEIIKHLNFQLARIQFESMQALTQIALVRYRSYLRGLFLGRREPFKYLPDVAGHDLAMIGRELLSSGYDYRILELTVPEPLDQYKVLVVPLAEFMSAEAQTTLVELLRKGVEMVFYGLVPRCDERNHPCEILARALGVRTTADTKIYNLETSVGSFAARTYGHFRRIPARARKLAKSGAKNFAVSSKSARTNWHFLTFDPAPTGNAAKGQFFSTIWADHQLTALTGSSDATVTAILHANGKNGLLYVFENSALIPCEQSAEVEVTETLPVVIRADIAAAGIKARRVTLTDMFSEQVTKVTAAELKNGIQIEVKPGDSFLYYIDRV